MIYPFIFILIICFVAGIFYQKEVFISSNPKDFSIYIFDIKDSSAFKHKEKSVQLAVQKVDLHKSKYIITADKIINYDWKTQTFQIKNEWQLRGEEVPEYMKDSGMFVIVFKGQRIVGGRVAYVGSAIPMPYPVLLERGIYREGENILEYSLSSSNKYVSFDPAKHEQKFPVDDKQKQEELRVYFEQLSKK